MTKGGPERHCVKLFTDGACIPNPGPGGWAFILKHVSTGRSKESSGGEHGSTNNRMEIMAVIRGLEALKQACDVELFSDSDYVVSAITDWMRRWKRFGWKKSPKSTKPLKNADLWIRLDKALEPHRVTAKWIRGHIGHPENERCDELANSAAVQIAQTTPPPPVDLVEANVVEKPYSGSLFDKGE
jgi:ribonuclease HI